MNDRTDKPVPDWVCYTAAVLIAVLAMFLSVQPAHAEGETRRVVVADVQGPELVIDEGYKIWLTPEASISFADGVDGQPLHLLVPVLAQVDVVVTNGRLRGQSVVVLRKLADEAGRQ